MGQVLPAHPLALTPHRELDERRQRALTRHYVDAGAGGIAVGVHTTQFEIRDPRHGLYRPVLELAASSAKEWLDRDARTRGGSPRSFIRIAGLVGDTRQANGEAAIARDADYHCGLLSLGGPALATMSERALVAHCRTVSDTIPLFGFYLQPAVGGRALSAAFWRDFAEIPSVWAVKIAPFDRYRTMDVVRGIAESGRSDIALYTGNDDAIVPDLVTPFPASVGGRSVDVRIVGGLLGQWAMWTRRAAAMLDDIKVACAAGGSVPASLLTTGAALTDANGAIFDAANNFAGCLPGIHEVLRRQGLMRGVWCLDPRLRLSPGQDEAITRVLRAYPDLQDNAWVEERLDDWMA